MATVTWRIFSSTTAPRWHKTLWQQPLAPLHSAKRPARRVAPNAQLNGESYVITTPLFYVNARPHMGSAYPTIAADVMARFQRMRGKEVLFLTGTDEHGEKIAAAAQERGLPPKEHCDEMVVIYKQLWQQLEIAYDSFVRTTAPRHERFVQEVVDRVWQKGDIYLDQYEGYYCVDCEEYKDKDQMDADYNCLVHRKPCIFRQEENYFFRLSRYQSQIEELLNSRGDFVWPLSRRNEVVGWVKSGLKDFSISRLAVEWGIPLKQDPKHTIYVWFDALNGYLSGMFPEGQEPSPDRLNETNWPAQVHLIGKDILRFHAVYWPAMLMSAELPLPGQVFGHGFLTKNGMKMGKSLGNVLEPTALVDAYGSDAVRYYFMKEIVFGQDGDFSEERFKDLINAAFANDIGNLLNRTLGLLRKNCQGVIPVASSSVSEDHPLKQLVESSTERIAEAYESFRFTEACDAILAITARGNQYLQETTPWSTFKKGTEVEIKQAEEVLVAVLETVRIVAVFLSPIAPSLCGRIYDQLGFPATVYESRRWERDCRWGGLSEGQRTAEPKPVFQRLESERVMAAT